MPITKKSYQEVRRKSHPRGKPKVAETVLRCRGKWTDVPSVLSQAEVTAAHRTYIKRLETRRISPATIDKYNQCLATFQQYLGANPITEDSTIDFLHHLTLRGFKLATVRIYYHALKPFLASIGIPIKLDLDRSETQPIYHTPDQVQAILDVIAKRSDRWSKLAQRDALIFRMLAYTGMRRSELVSLKVRDINFYSAMIRVTGKKQKQRTIPIAPTIYHTLQKYTEPMQPGDLLFPIKPRRLWSMISRYARQAGIDNFHPHSLRHYFATQLIEASVSLRDAQELLGHTDISTTAIYLHVLPKHLSNAVSRLPILTNHAKDKP